MAKNLREYRKTPRWGRFAASGAVLGPPEKCLRVAKKMSSVVHVPGPDYATHNIGDPNVYDHHQLVKVALGDLVVVLHPRVSGAEISIDCRECPFSWIDHVMTFCGRILMASTPPRKLPCGNFSPILLQERRTFRTRRIEGSW